jgi:uncharacterized membrane protein
MFFWVTRKKVRRLFDVERIQGAIEAAERQTSGQIRVSVAPFFWGNVHRTAEKAFVRLGMSQTRERNGILFFVVPARRRFSILGDVAIHARVGQEFWDELTATVAAEFRQGNFTEGLVRGIEEAGRQLAVHFPLGQPRDGNELPDEIDFE